MSKTFQLALLAFFSCLTILVAEIDHQNRDRAYIAAKITGGEYAQ